MSFKTQVHWFDVSRICIGYIVAYCEVHATCGLRLDVVYPGKAKENLKVYYKTVKYNYVTIEEVCPANRIPVGSMSSVSVAAMTDRQWT